MNAKKPLYQFCAWGAGTILLTCLAFVVLGRWGRTDGVLVYGLCCIGAILCAGIGFGILLYGDKKLKAYVLASSVFRHPCVREPNPEDLRNTLLELGCQVERFAGEGLLAFHQRPGSHQKHCFIFLEGTSSPKLFRRLWEDDRRKEGKVSYVYLSQESFSLRTLEDEKRLLYGVDKIFLGLNIHILYHPMEKAFYYADGIEKVVWMKNDGMYSIIEFLHQVLDPYWGRWNSQA